MGVMESSVNQMDDALVPGDRDAAMPYARAMLRFRAARSAVIPALQALLDATDEYADAHQKLIDECRAAHEPKREMTLGRAWLDGTLIDDVHFRGLAFRAMERGIRPIGVLRP